MVICLERDADLHTAQLMPLPLTVSCFSKIQIGFTFLVPAHLGSPGQRAIKRMCVRVYHKKATKRVLKWTGLPTDCLLHYHTAVVHPVLEYCSCICTTGCVCVCVCVWLLSWAGVLARNSRVIDLVLNIHVGERDVLIGRQHIGVCSQVAVGVGGNSWISAAEHDWAQHRRDRTGELSQPVR